MEMDWRQSVWQGHKRGELDFGHWVHLHMWLCTGNGICRLTPGSGHLILTTRGEDETCQTSFSLWFSAFDF